jgi:AcrR family transcriptional regulator
MIVAAIDRSDCGWVQHPRAERRTMEGSLDVSTTGLRRRGQGAAGNGTAARERILAAFADRARTKGIRAVVMGDLARELAMSKKTLYQHFTSRDALVREIVERWIERVREHSRSPDAPFHDVQDLVRWWTEFWVKEQTDYCYEFWRDLETDHPASWKLFWDMIRSGVPAQARVAQWLRPGISPLIAADLYYQIIAFYNDPVVCSKFGFSRRESVLAAIEIWIGGALQPSLDPELSAGIEADPGPPRSASGPR